MAVFFLLKKLDFNHLSIEGETVIILFHFLKEPHIDNFSHYSQHVVLLRKMKDD